MDGPSWRPLLMEALRTAESSLLFRVWPPLKNFRALATPEKVALWEEAIDSLMTSVESDERRFPAGPGSLWASCWTPTPVRSKFQPRLW